MKATTALAVLAALILGSFASCSRAQGVITATALNPRGWPPRPSDMFQWINAEINTIHLQPGEDILIESVPADS